VLVFSLGLGSLFLSLYTGGDANEAMSILIAVGSTWAGLAISWYSSYPVSSFITTIACTLYGLVRAAGWVHAMTVPGR